MAVKRARSIKGHATAALKSTQIEWASPVQREAFEYGPAPQLYSGGFGSGKTWAACLKALWISSAFPGNRGVIGRRVAKELFQTTQATFYKICPPAAYEHGGERSDSRNYLRLNNGSEVLWMHLEDAETENVIRGLEINWFVLDQAEEIDEALFDLLMSRLGRWDKTTVPAQLLGSDWQWKNRAGQPIVPIYPILTCNPDTELHWLYRRFHPESPEHYERKFPWNGSMRSYADMGYRMFSFPSDSNRFLPEQNLSQMLANDESFIRRFVRGEWGIPEGQIHTVPAEAIIPGDPHFVEYLKRTCTLHRTLDHGDAAPTCCLWWAVDRDGNAFCYREYYLPNALISQHRANISALSVDEVYTLQLADPSIHFKTQQKHGGRWSVADEYSDSVHQPRETAIWWQPGDNNELGTRNRISEYLRVDPERIHPVTKQKGAPRLFFVKRSAEYPQGCDHVIRELRAQRRERLGTDLGRPTFSDERDMKIADHAYDAVRYFVASRPPVAQEMAKRWSQKSWYGRREQALKWKKLARYRNRVERLSA